MHSRDEFPYLLEAISGATTEQLQSSLTLVKEQLEKLCGAYPESEEVSYHIEAPTADELESGDPLVRISALKAVRDRMELELIDRGMEVGTATATTGVEEKNNPYRGDHNVHRRKNVIANYPQSGAKELCAEFDENAIPIPEKWTRTAPDVKNWVTAYKKPKLRNRIDKMISKDRDAVFRGSRPR